MPKGPRATFLRSCYDSAVGGAPKASLPAPSSQVDDWSWVRLGGPDTHLRVSSPRNPFENNPFDKPFASFHWCSLLELVLVVLSSQLGMQ